jgi:RNA polymerase sigma-70 factor (ECF subfamily)
MVETSLAPDPQVIGALATAISVVERDRLDREVGRLPVDQRAVMVVHYYLDMPLSAAAEILDIPVGTAKSRLHHGLAALRRSIGRESDPPQTAVRERTA